MLKQMQEHKNSLYFTRIFFFRFFSAIISEQYARTHTDISYPIVPNDIHRTKEA